MASKLHTTPSIGLADAVVSKTAPVSHHSHWRTRHVNTFPWCLAQEFNWAKPTFQSSKSLKKPRNPASEVFGILRAIPANDG